MRKALKAILNSLNDVEFRELKMCTDVADYTKGIMEKYEVTHEQLSKETGIPEAKLFNFTMGTHGYDIQTICKINGAIQKLAKPLIDSIKVKEQK